MCVYIYLILKNWNVHKPNQEKLQMFVYIRPIKYFSML